jgi:TolB-like protein/tetratricopeptide (TPR) repeat protein/predicted Ser/Thr protein kinase
VTDLLDQLQASLGDRYEVERELGSGGMAIVYLARDLKHDRLVALKVMRPELAASLGGERFVREISIAAKLSHPHILPLYDSGEANGLLYYVMPYVDGESLRDLLDREQQLPLEDAVRITREVADALSHAHSYGIIHRDIKPENIMLTGGHAVVADFGIARAFSAAGGDSLTQTGMAVGTPAYMSPEQAAGDSNLDGRTDMYSLGCVLYEMLVGQVPFTGPNAQAIMARHTMDVVTPPSIMRQSVPEELENVLLRSLEKSPADRFRTAGDFSEALVSLDSGTYTPRRTTRAATQRVVARRRKRRRVTTMAASAVGVVAVGIVAWQLLSGKGPTTSIGGLDPRSVGVLYFEDLSADESLGYVADGLTEGIIDRLAVVQQLDVVSSNGSAQYRDSELTRDSIARALDVGSLIVGSVEPTRGQLRVSIRLVDGNSGADIAREALQLPSDQLITMQDSVVDEAARMLRVHLGQEVRLRERRSGTESVVAWSGVQQAERVRKQSQVECDADDVDGCTRDLLLADSILAVAERADESWIEPIVLRGMVAYRLAGLAENRDAAMQWTVTALGHANRALDLEPSAPEALELRGTDKFFQWVHYRPTDLDEAEGLLELAREDLQAAVEAGPTLASAHQRLSSVLAQQGDFTSSMIEATRAYEEDAYLENADDILGQLFWSAYNLEQHTQALDWCQEGYRRFPDDPRFTECRLWLLTTNARAPNVDEAWRLADEFAALSPETDREYNYQSGRIVVGGVLARAGLIDSARAVLERAQVSPTVDPNLVLTQDEAYMWILVGDYDRAIDLLELYHAANPDEDHGGGESGELFWWWRDLQTYPRFSELQRGGG